jgi:hypothetical protein
MFLIDQLAEQNIKQAIDNGELDDLPGAGKPLELEDLSTVPPELRAGYLMLKNAGYVPPQVNHLNELKQVEQLIRQADAVEERTNLTQRANYLSMCLEKSGVNLSALSGAAAYRDKVMNKIIK